MYTRTRVVNGRDSGVIRRMEVSVRDMQRDGKRALLLIGLSDGYTAGADSVLLHAHNLQPIYRGHKIGAFHFAQWFEPSLAREIRTRPIGGRGAQAKRFSVDTVSLVAPRAERITIVSEMHLRLVLQREKLHATWSQTFDGPQLASTVSESGERASHVLRVVGDSVRQTALGRRAVWKVSVTSRTRYQVWVDKVTGDVVSEEVFDDAGRVVVRVDWS